MAQKSLTAHQAVLLVKHVHGAALAAAATRLLAKQLRHDLKRQSRSAWTELSSVLRQEQPGPQQADSSGRTSRMKQSAGNEHR